MVCALLDYSWHEGSMLRGRPGASLDSEETKKYGYRKEKRFAVLALRLPVRSMPARFYVCGRFWKFHMGRSWDRPKTLVAKSSQNIGRLIGP